MAESRFVYVTYIRATAEKLWDVLLKPEFTKRYWSGTTQISDWKAGAAWKLMLPDGRIADAGEVLEIDPPRKLMFSWRKEFMPELKVEGYSRCTYLLETMGKSVKLTVIHEIDKPASKLIAALAGGWPHVLASLKSLLETGESLEETLQRPKEI